MLAYDRKNDPDLSAFWKHFHSRGECTILCEEQVIAEGDFSIQPTVLQTFEAERANRVYGVSQAPEGLDETFWQVLIEKDPHEAASSLDWASSSRAPRTASSVNVG